MRPSRRSRPARIRATPSRNKADQLSSTTTTTTSPPPFPPDGAPSYESQTSFVGGGLSPSPAAARTESPLPARLGRESVPHGAPSSSDSIVRTFVSRVIDPSVGRPREAIGTHHRVTLGSNVARGCDDHTVVISSSANFTGASRDNSPVTRCNP